jgi:hypothetical protein
MFLLERKCPFTGTVNAMELPMTQREYFHGVTAWLKGALIQVAFPTLNAEQREFIKTGITPEMLAKMFGEDADA